MREIRNVNLDGISPIMLRFVGGYFSDCDVEATAARLGIDASAGRQLYSEPPVKAVIGAVWQAILEDVATYGRAIHQASATPAKAGSKQDGIA